MFNKDTFRLIKRTKKRFLTLFVIVIIGVGFMIGLLSSSPYLQYSVDHYDDEYNLMDVQIYSSYGFCDEDVTAVAKTRGVKNAEGTHFVDVFGTTNGENLSVTRVQELNNKINKFKLIDGRMPENSSEALVLNSEYAGGFKIGETVTLSLDDEQDEELDDKLARREFKIVGIVESPQYLAVTQETSTLNNLDLNNVIYVSNNNFIFDLYTSMYVTFEDTADKLAFSEAYQDEVDRNIRVLERTKESQSGFLKDKIISEVEEKIADGQKELDEKLSEADHEIVTNEKKLHDAYIEIMTGEGQISATETQLKQAEEEIKRNETLIAENEQKIKEGIALVETTTGKNFDTAYSEVEAAHTLYTSLEIMQDQLPEQIAAAKKELAANEALITDKTVQIKDKNEELQIKNLELGKLNAELLTLTPGTEEYAAQEEKIAAKQLEIDTLSAEILQITNEIAQLETKNAALKVIINNENSSTIQEMMDKINAEAGGDIKKSYSELKMLKDGQAQLAVGKQQLEAGKQQLESGKKQLNEAKNQLSNGRKEYESGLKQLNDAKYQLGVEREKAENELAKARQDLSELPEADWMILDRQGHYSSVMFDATLGQMGSIGRIFPLLFFMVAALVCLTTMTRLIDEERTQLGVFSALGFSKAKIISKYVLYAFLASFGGSLIGIVVGVYTFPIVIYSVWHLMYYLPPLTKVLLPSVAFTGVASFTILMMGVTWYVAHRELKTMPSQLMRPKPPKTAKKVFLEKIPFIWNHLSFTTKITARNILRYKQRFIMTVIGVAGCTGLLVAGWGIKDSIADVINLNFSSIYKYNYTVTLDDDRHEEPVYNALLEESANEQVVPFMQYISKVHFEDEDDKTISVEVFDDRQIGRVVDLRTRKKGEPLSISGDGVIISEKFAKLHHLSVGDELSFESKNGIKAIVEVDGICEMYFQHHLFISDELYEDIFNEKVHNESIAVTTSDGEGMKATLDKLEGIKSITSFEPMIDSFESMIKALDFIIVVIILAAGSLAFVVLMNLTAVNISERLREIATLKVLGFNDHEVNHYIFEEILILTIIGGLVGMPVGKLEHTIIMSTIDVEMVMFGSNIRLMSFVYGFAVTMCFTAIVLVFMSRNLKKVEMVESLKSVE